MKYYKKIVGLMLAIVMIVSLSACGAFVPPNADVIDESTDGSLFNGRPSPTVAGEEENYVLDDGVVEDYNLVLDINEDVFLDYNPSNNADCLQQLKLIASHKKEWYVSNGNGNIYDYTVTDLNYNGRIEIVQTTCQGTGFFSTTKIWEVSSDMTSLNRVEYVASSEVGASYSDIINYKEAQAYYDYKDKVFHYILGDFIRADLSINATTYMDFYYSGGRFYDEILATVVKKYDKQGHETIEYSDSTGALISERLYNEYVKGMFSLMKPCIVSFGWAHDMNLDIENAKGDELAEVLLKVCERFSIQDGILEE